MNLRIFAKLGTDEKVAVMCGHGQNSTIATMLSKQFGGNWLFVETVHSCIEGIKFNDGQIYNGFNPDIEKYSSAIIEIVKHGNG